MANKTKRIYILIILCIVCIAVLLWTSNNKKDRDVQYSDVVSDIVLVLDRDASTGDYLISIYGKFQKYDYSNHTEHFYAKIIDTSKELRVISGVVLQGDIMYLNNKSVGNAYIFMYQGKLDDDKIDIVKNSLDKQFVTIELSSDKGIISTETIYMTDKFPDSY